VNASTPDVVTSVGVPMSQTGQIRLRRDGRLVTSLDLSSIFPLTSKRHGARSTVHDCCSDLRGAGFAPCRVSRQEPVAHETT
jgi:hypothetical protein